MNCTITSLNTNGQRVIVKQTAVSMLLVPAMCNRQQIATNTCKNQAAAYVPAITVCDQALFS